MTDTFKFLRILVWAAPAAFAYNAWGVQVALLTFGCQMFSVNPLTKMYAVWKSREGEVQVEDVQRFYLMINLIAGAAYAFFIHSLIGGQPPGPTGLFGG